MISQRIKRDIIRLAMAASLFQGFFWVTDFIAHLTQEPSRDVRMLGGLVAIMIICCRAVDDFLEGHDL